MDLEFELSRFSGSTFSLNSSKVSNLAYTSAVHMIHETAPSVCN